MPKKFDVVKAMGTYTDPQTGQEKTRWLKCGMIIQNQNGNMSLKLDALPIGVPTDSDGGMWFALMTPTPRQGGGQAPPQQAGGFRQPGPPQGDYGGQTPPQQGGYPAGSAGDGDVPF